MPIRSLADDLRGRDDAALAELLSARPDLLHPVPADMTALAARAGSATSTSRALDGLDRLTLQVAEVLAVLPEPSRTDDVVAEFPRAAADAARAALHRLRMLALAWGEDDALRLVRTAADALGTAPCGLGAAGAASRPMLLALTPERLQSLLDQAPGDCLDLLAELTWGPPTRRVRGTSAALDWLTEHDLLLAKGDVVTLPREVALLLRQRDNGERVLVREAAYPPALPRPGASYDLAEVDRAAGLQALAATTAVGTLLDAWSGDDAPTVLRKGGLSVRDLAAAARLLDVDEDTATVWIEIAYAAGLLARDGEIDEAWRPTTAYDDWREDAAADRWRLLQDAWRQMVRTPALVASPVTALSDDAENAAMPALRRQVLDALSLLPPGHAHAGSDDIVRVLDERSPRRASALRTRFVASILRECELLGLTARGALSSAAEDPHAMDGHIPPALDHVLLQADLTAIAPGPLEPALDREMRSLADVESTGGATVFRFSDASVRRGLDEGRDAPDVIAFLEQVSRTPVPQPLRYLVEDVARRHGVVRMGLLQGYVRCEDPHAIAALLADPRSQGLGVVPLSPTVAGVSGPLEPVLAVLRELGLHAVAEAPDGTAVVPTRRQRRARASLTRRPSGKTPAPPRLVAAAVAALRGSAATIDVPRAREDTLEPMTASQTLAVLRRAVQDSTPVRLAPSGAEDEELVEPLRISAGVLTALVRSTGELRTFPVARIVAAHPATVDH